MPKQTQNYHQPVLLREVLEQLHPIAGESYLDMTAGYGGHATEVLKRTNNRSDSILVDRDAFAISKLHAEFKLEKDGPRILHSDFLSAAQQLVSEGCEFDMILADLGLSSPHIDIASRGFSFDKDGPLDMRMDQSRELSAEIVVNTYSEEALTHLLLTYGEDPKASRIAKEIVSSRPIHTTHELAEVVSRVWPTYVKGRPVARTFQALRIEVNDELKQLRESLPLILKLLKKDGRVAIITFHSLEDRIVKDFFKEYGGERFDADLKILTKRPLVASHNELVSNPRSRSAKLRVAAKK